MLLLCCLFQNVHICMLTYFFFVIIIIFITSIDEKNM